MRTGREDARAMRPMLGVKRSQEGFVVGGRIEIVELRQRYALAREFGLIDEDDVEPVERFRGAAFAGVEIGGELRRRGPRVGRARRLRAAGHSWHRGVVPIAEAPKQRA